MTAVAGEETTPPKPLVPLPDQPDGVPWPTLAWSTGPQLTGDPDRVEDILNRAFTVNPNDVTALSLAVVVIQGGRVVAERYGPGIDARTPLISWSMAKSITQALCGVLFDDGVVDLDSPGVAPEWSDDADPRHEISLTHLLRMRSGLEFNEDYIDAEISHCIEMLFGEGAHDTAAYAASQALLHPPDSVWNYSSGSTNIICRHLADRLVGSSAAPDTRIAAIDEVLSTRIFGPLGMTTATPRHDAAGTFIGSSYVYASARDFARFGFLYLRGGEWDGQRILSRPWVDRARVAHSVDPDDGVGYSEHWWTAGPLDHPDLGTFWANGYEGQRIMAVPAADLLIVRLGKTPAAHRPGLLRFYRDLIAAFTD